MGGMGRLLSAQSAEFCDTTLWSAKALVTPAGQSAVIDDRLEYLAAGADVITTNNYPWRF